jgi:hypothetical protein
MSTATEAAPSLAPATKRRRVRPWLWVLMGLAVIAGRVAIIGATHDSAAFHEPTAQEVASANQLVTALGVPAGATRDLYGTACGFPDVTYCITSAKATPQQLLDAVLAEARGQGASVKGNHCPPPAKDPFDAPAIGRCGATIHFHGAQLQVLADDATAFGVKNPAWLLVLAPSINPVPTDALTRPLGAWESLHLLPAGWTGAATCTAGSAKACTGYKLTLVRPGNATTMMAQLQAAIRKAGYKLDVANCRKAAAGISAGCSLGAMRFQTVGGQHLLILTAHTRQTTASQATVTLLVGDPGKVALPKASLSVVLPPAKS